ncbi:MAG: hypothetical protein IH588_05530, partial [Anaerolineales bacterium]|nr:hypothetical protein [Anaerolineales bacterium]
MLRFIVRRLVSIPIILAAANFLGFYFAFSIAPIVSTNNPYSQGSSELPPIVPEYLNYLSNVSQGNFGTTFNGENVTEAISRVSIASTGLIGIALPLSIV